MPIQRRSPRSSSAELEPVQGVVVLVGIDRIRQLEAEFDSIHTEAMASALANRWEAAQLYAAELAAGRSQREVARLVGKDQSHVSRMVRVWREHGDDQVISPYSFDRYYQLAKVAKKPRAIAPLKATATEPEADYSAEPKKGWKQRALEAEAKLADDPAAGRAGRPERPAGTQGPAHRGASGLRPRA